jgi:hypothetical protein
MDALLPFRHAPLLFGLLVPALLLWWVWARRGRNLVVPFDHAASPRGTGLRALVNSAESLPAALLGCVVLILAGQGVGAKPFEAQSRRREHDDGRRT